MALFRKKAKPPFEKFLTNFNLGCELILTLATDEDGTPRRFSPEDMATSASAIVAAAYVAKNTSVLAGSRFREGAKAISG